MRVREDKNPVSKTTENLAKLMATENITVEFKKVSTPSFELVSRTLTLPLWRDISKETYNMLVAHEVSHALYTPTKEWGEAASVSEKRRVAANVVEDARIEKMIMKKYPGCRFDFLKGYKELHEKDFFGLSKGGLDDRTLLDRINLYYKSYGNVYVPFSEEENVWINRIDKISSFAEALEIADELIKYDESKKEEDPISNVSDDSALSNDSEELDSTENGSESEDSDSEGEDDGSGSADDDSSESDDNESNSSEEGKDNEETDDEASENGSITDGDSDEEDSADGSDDKSDDDTESKEVKSSMQSLEEKLTNISESNRYDRYGDRYNNTIHLFNPYLEDDFNKVILPMKDFLMYANRKSSEFYNNYKTNPDINLITPSDAYATIRSENIKVVNNMVKTFEMKKSATLNARTMTAKTGLIDMNRLPFYKLTDDIFLQNEVTPKGKNHAILMYLDMSGSMNGERITSALSQIINMAMFCDKVSIPYRVYAFTDHAFDWARSSEIDHTTIKRKEWKLGFNIPYGRFSESPTEEKYVGFHYEDSGLSLVELIRSDAPKADRLSAMGFFASSIINYRENIKPGYRPIRNYAYNFTYGLTGSTPLNAALYIAPKLINSYRKEVNAEKMNFFIYTDGDATDPFYNFKNNRTAYSSSYVDPVNGYYKVSRNDGLFHLYNVLVDRIKFLTGSTIIGMRVGSVRDLAANYQSMMELYNDRDNNGTDFEIRSTLRKEGFCHSNDVLGYDHFTWATNSFMNVENTTIDDELGIKKDNEDISKRVISGAFMRSHKKNHQSRVMVDKIMEIVA